MRKSYCSPVCEFVQVEIDCIMQAASDYKPGGDTGVDFGGSTGGFDGPQRRGEWGNLWGGGN